MSSGSFVADLYALFVDSEGLGEIGYYYTYTIHTKRLSTYVTEVVVSRATLKILAKDHPRSS